MSSGGWVPRALKKRPGEFGVAASAAPHGASSSSAPTTIGTAAPLSVRPPPPPKFNGEADLDELADEEELAQPSSAPPPAKRQNVGGGEAAVAAAVGSSSSTRDEIKDGAPRLAVHITSASKFNKVAAMSYALLEGKKVNRDNASAFFAVLEAGMLDTRRLRDPKYHVAFRQLYSSAIGKAALFPQAAQPRLKLWEVQVLAQIELFTDDTYQFDRAAKRVRESLYRLPCIYPALEPPGAVHLPEGERRAWADALFDCVGSAMAHFKYPWARTSCDMLVKALVDRRQNFDDAQQAEMQLWNQQSKGQKVVRQQEGARARDLSSFERKESEWRSADIAKNEKGGDAAAGGGGGGLDGWVAKQANN